MNYSKIKSYAKINLALNIIGKAHKLHQIESVVSFLNLYDEISIKSTKNKNHKITNLYPNFTIPSISHSPSSSFEAMYRFVDSSSIKLKYFDVYCIITPISEVFPPHRLGAL